MVATRTSSILGPDGRPVEVALLTQEVAAPTRWGARHVHTEAVSSGLTPERLASLMRAADQGQARQYLTLAIEMQERYMHYRGQLQVRRLAFDAVSVSVTAPKSVPARIVDAVHELVADPEFRAACSDLQDGVPKGFSVVEPVWEYQRGHLRPVAYKHRDPRFFAFDELSLSELRLATDTGVEGPPLPQGVFIRHLPRIETGLPLRRGLARPAAWAFIVQSFTLQDWSAFAEIYGVPFRLGKYHAGATDADKRMLLRALLSIANDGAGIIPSGMEMEFISVSGQHGEAVFGNLISYLDRQVSKLVLGQTMTADAGTSGSLAQAKVHNEVRLDILRADGQQTAATLNRDLIPWFVAYNYGPQDAYPQVEFPVSEPEDVKALSEAVARLVPLGLKVSQRQMRDKLALSEPEGDEELLAPPAPPRQVLPGQGRQPASEPLAGRPAHVRGCQCAGCLGPARLAAEDVGTTEDEPDAIDHLLAEQLARWPTLVDPLLEQLFALAAECGSYEEVLARLDRLRLDSEPLRRRLAIATTISRGLGDVGME